MSRILGTLTMLLILLTQSLAAGWEPADSIALPVVAYPGTQWNVRGVSDGKAGTVMVWQDRRDGATDKVFAQRVDATGAILWNQNGVQLSRSVGFQYYPQIAADGNGGAFVVWQDNRTGIDYDIYIQHISQDGLPLWGENAAVVCAATGHQYNPRLVPDGTGGVIVVWQDKRRGAWDIYAQHITADGNRGWSLSGQLICEAEQDQLDPQIVTDGFGGAIIAWTDYRLSTTFPDIYSQHINADGSIHWALTGVAICRVGNIQMKSQLVADGAGGAIVSWQDRRSGTVDQIFVQRIDWNGEIAWTAGGVGVSISPGIQFNQRMAADGAGGAYIVWQDNRTGSEYDIYAQRINHEGGLLWSGSGLAICTAAGHQYNPEITVDASGVFFGWQDKRNGTDFEIFVQSCNVGGTIRWQANGLPVLRSTADQINPTVVPDGVSGVICAWTDFQGNSGSSDVYAQRVGGNGLVGGGQYRSFTQAEYAQKALRFSSHAKGIFALPNVGNLRDTLFKRRAFPDGIRIGIERKDDRRSFGWITYSRSSYITRALPQNGSPRPFDIAGKRRFTGPMFNPSTLRYDNRLVGEVLALKLNIAASDAGIVPTGFGDLIFNDFSNPGNPLNRRSLRSIVSHIDSALTMWKSFPALSYGLFDSTLRRINQSCAGTIDTIDTSPLKFTAVKSIFSVPFLAPGVPAGTSILEIDKPFAVKSISDEELAELPLLQNYPNPFNPLTQIEFNLPERSIVTLSVFNILGQEVARLFDQEALEGGPQTAEFDGSSVASGTYFYKLSVVDAASGKPTATIVKKMNLVK